MKNSIYLILVALVVFGLASNASVARTWTDRKGRTVDADFLGFKDGKAHIKRNSDGKEFAVPFDRLSDADQEFVKAAQKPRSENATDVQNVDAAPKSDAATTAEKILLLANAFEEAKVERPHALTLLIFVGGHSSDRLATLAKRIPKIEREVRTEWQAAFRTATADSVDLPNTLILMAQIDPMWKETDLIPDREDAYLVRLKSIPAQETKRWAKSAEKKVPAAAADLLVIDALFKDGEFSASALTEHIEKQSEPKKAQEGSRG